MRRLLFRIARVCLKVVLAFLLAIAITHLIAPDLVPRLLGRPQPAEWRIPSTDDSPALASDRTPEHAPIEFQHQDLSIG
jgi:hypothetical protein